MKAGDRKERNRRITRAGGPERLQKKPPKKNITPLPQPCSMGWTNKGQTGVVMRYNSEFARSLCPIFRNGRNNAGEGNDVKTLGSVYPTLSQSWGGCDEAEAAATVVGTFEQCLPCFTLRTSLTINWF